MANFRAERLFIRVSGAVDFDPNEGVDPSEFAFLMVRDAGSLDRAPLSEFTFAPFDQPRWFSAAEGLQAVRAFIVELEATLADCDPERRPHIEGDIAILRAVEDRLDWIDVKDLRFHFLARDLG